MPLIKIEMLAGRSRAQKEEIAEVLSRELARIACCELADVQLIISDVAQDHWAVGGKLPKKNPDS